MESIFDILTNIKLNYQNVTKYSIPVKKKSINYKVNYHSNIVKKLISSNKYLLKNLNLIFLRKRVFVKL